MTTQIDQKATTMSRTDSHSVAAPPNVDDALAVARRQLRGMRYGIVQIVVHDGQVVQIERTERTRVTLNDNRQRADQSELLAAVTQ